MSEPKRSYADLHEHLEALKAQGLLLTIDRAVDKDAELHPLVRWQFVGGIDQDIGIQTHPESTTRTDKFRGVENAVAEIGLGDRAEADDGAGLGDARPFAGIGVRGVDEAPARIHRRVGAATRFCH